MVKVMYVIEHLVVGGAQKLVLQYAQKLDKDLFDVTVVCSDNRTGSFIDEMLEESGIRVIYLGDIVGDDKFESKSIEKYRAFEQVYNEEQPDIIHTHINTNDYFLTVDTQADNVKLFHSVHRDPAHFIENEKLHLNRTKQLIKERQLMLLTLHEQMNEDVKTIFETERTAIVQNGIDFALYQNPSFDTQEMRRKNGIPEDAYVVGTVSRLDPVKNHRRLLSIFKTMKSKKADAVLVIVGEGDIREELETLAGKLEIENDVYFLGERKDVPDLLNMMDAFVFPSFLEAFPTVLIEAQAAGVECFVSEGVSDSLNLTNYIHWIDLDESDEVWADTILTTFTENKTLEGLDHYSIDHAVKHLEKLYLD